MLWNGEFAYIYMPRTASRSLCVHFVQNWKGPVFGTASQGHVNEIVKSVTKPNFVSVGRGHENLVQAKLILSKFGRTFTQFKKIIFVVRNPYDLVLSNYYFLKQSYPTNKNNKNCIIANESNFEEFCLRFSHPDVRNWFMLDGTVLGNMQIIRYEHLKDDLSLVEEFSSLNIDSISHYNKIPRNEDMSAVLTVKAESIIYEAYQHLFAFGQYRRETIEAQQ